MRVTYLILVFAAGCAHSSAPSALGQGVRVAGPDGMIFAPLGLPALREHAWVTGDALYDCLGSTIPQEETPLGAIEFRLIIGGERARVEIAQTSTSRPVPLQHCVEQVLGGVDWRLEPVQIPIFMEHW